MEIDELVARIRDHYLETFRAFALEAKAECTQGSPEVMIRLDDASALFGHVCRLDFVKNDGQPEILELVPERVLRFEPLSGSIGETNLQMEDLRWDDLVLHHDSPKPLSRIDAWFEQWFDPDEKRYDKNAEFSGAIHSLIVAPDSLSVDLGTAPTDAFFSLLSVLVDEGATNIRVSGSRGEAEAE